MSQTIDHFERLGDAATPAKADSHDAARTAPAERNLAVGYLRAVITVLVLFHHSVIAYIPGLPKAPAVFGQQPFTWGAFPVVDPNGWAGFGLFTGINEAFFMSLMFFVSGLFVFDSLKRKGAGGFLRDRVVRLGVPFAVAATLLAPIAYYPAYLVTGADPSVFAFARTWAGLGTWPAGPAWFIWVLLAFGALAAGLYRLAPGAVQAIGAWARDGERRPLLLFAKLFAASLLAYGAFALMFGQVQWLAFGPFAIQAARVLHYLVYFAGGIGVGAIGLASGLLAPDGALQRRWWAWTIAAPFAFLLSAVLAISGYVAKISDTPVWQVVTSLGYALACASISFACMAVFVRFVHRRSAIWDSLAANAYGMYLVHYMFVTWLQYALLPQALPGFAKGLLVCAGVLALSWATTAALRRVPGVARVI